MVESHEIRLSQVHGRKCENCGQPCKKVCAGCLSSRFCSRDCQRKCWPSHRGVCNTMKDVRTLIKEKKLLELHGLRGTTPLEIFAHHIGAKVMIKEAPSRKANGRLRGKQARCSDELCTNPGAVGTRYLWAQFDEKHCVCACAALTAARSPLLQAYSARRRPLLFCLFSAAFLHRVCPKSAKRRLRCGIAIALPLERASRAVAVILHPASPYSVM